MEKSVENKTPQKLAPKPISLDYSKAKRSKELSLEDLSIKKEESIDSIQKEPKEEEVKEDIEETCDQRKIRRTTLQKDLLGDSDKSSKFIKSIDIRNLEANIFLKEKLNLETNEVIKLHKSDKKMMKKMRKAFNRVNSYCEVFNTKSEVLLSILIDLLTKYIEGVNQKIFYYGRLKDVYSPWMSIIVNSKALNCQIGALNTKKYQSETKVPKGLLGAQMLSPPKAGGSPERIRSCSRNLAFDAINLVESEPKLKKSKFSSEKMDKNDEDEEIELRRSRSFDHDYKEFSDEDGDEGSDRRSKSVEFEFVAITECTRLNFLRKYKDILKQNKLVVNDLGRWKAQLNSRINNLLNTGSIKEILEKINELLKEFSVIYSKNFQWLIEGEQIFNNLNPDRNLFILEMKICTLMKQFRTIIDHNLIETISELNKEIGSMILPHSQFLIEESKALNHIGKVLYGEKNWNPFPLKNDLISIPFQPLNMFQMISPRFRKYMKLKLNLQKNSVVKNEDLIDFFKFYKIKYLKQSPFLIRYLRCLNQANISSAKNDFSLLCLDVNFPIKPFF